MPLPRSDYNLVESRATASGHGVGMPYSGAAVGNEFLSLASQEAIPIDQMKLQKLLYYAHAWFLANFDQPLIEEEIEAWPWGPVIRSVYYDTVGAGRAPLMQKLRSLERVGVGALDFRVTIPELSDTNAKTFVKSVWDTHKAFSGIQLSNSTHAPGEPWTIVKEQYGDLDKKPPIPNELIKAVFKKKLADNVATTANQAAQ